MEILLHIHLGGNIFTFSVEHTEYGNSRPKVDVVSKKTICIFWDRMKIPSRDTALEIYRYSRWKFVPTVSSAKIYNRPTFLGGKMECAVRVRQGVLRDGPTFEYPPGFRDFLG